MRFLALLLVFFAVPAFAGEQPLPPLTGGPVIHLSGTVGTAAAAVLVADLTRGFLQIQNVGLNTNVLSCTLDSSTPTIGGNGIQLGGVATGAGQNVMYSGFVPNGALACIGSGASTGYTVTYMQ